MSNFTDDWCDANCGCDQWWFNFVSQNAHWAGGALFVVGVPMLFGKWITWWAAVVFTIYAAVKEYAIDPATEDPKFAGSGDQDFAFYIVGVILGLIVVYISQLKGSMWPWPARCWPFCPPTPEEDAELGICCGASNEEQLFTENHPFVRRQQVSYYEMQQQKERAIAERERLNASHRL